MFLSLLFLLLFQFLIVDFFTRSNKVYIFIKIISHRSSC
nr:MAG TPA: hypothetical protein [Caudoviricetes sp.]